MADRRTKSRKPGKKLTAVKTALVALSMGLTVGGWGLLSNANVQAMQQANDTTSQVAEVVTATYTATSTLPPTTTATSTLVAATATTTATPATTSVATATVQPTATTAATATATAQPTATATTKTTTAPQAVTRTQSSR